MVMWYHHLVPGTDLFLKISLNIIFSKGQMLRSSIDIFNFYFNQYYFANTLLKKIFQYCLKLKMGYLCALLS